MAMELSKQHKNLIAMLKKIGVREDSTIALTILCKSEQAAGALFLWLHDSGEKDLSKISAKAEMLAEKYPA